MIFSISIRSVTYVAHSFAVTAYSAPVVNLTVFFPLLAKRKSLTTAKTTGVKQGTTEVRVVKLRTAWCIFVKTYP